MIQTLNKLKDFIVGLANDPRIPDRDKKVVLALLALVISPIDIIPDWIPILGQLDDVMMLALLLDYFFSVLDQDVILSHYPWGLRSFLWLKRFASVVSSVAPGFLKRRLWKYTGSPYGSLPRK